MADNTTLKVTIIGDSRSAQRAMSGLSGKSDGLVAKLGSVAGTVGKAFGGAGLIVGGLGIAAGKMGLEVAAGNEQAQIAFGTMLGSGQKAKAFLDDLQKFAAATPFEFPELQTAASSLISAGIEADKVIPIMTTLGDVTSGMGTGSEGVKRATIALQQMSAAGRITGEDLNQLRDAGIPVYDLLSKATGKSKAEVVKLAQAGKLGSKELGQMMKALETGKGMERFSGLMQKQSASLTGMWSTLKDTLGQGLAKAIEPLIPLIKDGLGKASEWLAGILPKVSEGLKNAVKWVKNFANEYSKGTGAGGAFRKVVEAIGNAVSVAADFIKDAAGKVKDFIAQYQAGEGAGGKFRDVVERIGEVVQEASAWIKDNSTLVGSLAVAILTGVAAWKTYQFAVSVVSAYTKAYAAAQVILNAVLTANPIGLVIVAIAALAAGLIYAYKNSETFRNIVQTAFKAVGAIVQWLWEHWMRPFFKFFLGVISILAEGWAVMLDILGNVPGFGWAKDAADKIRGAKKSVDDFSGALDNIDPYVPVSVVTTFTYKGYKASLDKHNTNVLISKMGDRGFASGGTNIPAGMAWVGEQGPELMYVPGGSTIWNAKESARMAKAGPGPRALTGGGSDGGVTVVINVGGHVTTERDLVAYVRNELVKFGRRNGGKMF